eukprot:m.354243 g.354243  ORF g.354243 m.354243 type:complete len:115 (-) comp16962_c0_seq1:293-637(-)
MTRQQVPQQLVDNRAFSSPQHVTTSGTEKPQTRPTRTTFGLLVQAAHAKNQAYLLNTNRPLRKSLLQQNIWCKLQRYYAATPDQAALDSFPVLRPEELYPLCTCDNPTCGSHRQ